MWCKVITRGRVFDEKTDAPRFREAFVRLGERTTWPRPRDFMEAMPSNVKPFKKPLRLDNEGVRKARMQSFADIADHLGIKLPSARPAPTEAA